MPDTKDHTVFYLKYRPQSLSELIGQDSVKKNLSSAFADKKLAHAYLFVGPRGTGKTSTARILAKMVNCQGQDKVKGEVPCNECEMCLSITDGSNLDLIEIDAASNRGIEDIRFLREKIKLAPTVAKKKVYIIDEVHMLTSEAFNALLKTLEEPPLHALFILATTEGSKIPQTILSRVQRLDFILATSDQLLAALQKIVQMEKINIDDEALKLLIKKSGGSFRDGVKLLDQVSSSEGKITTSAVERIFKFTAFEINVKLVEFFSQKALGESLQLVTKQVTEGADIKELILSLMDNFRDLMFIKNGLGEQLVKGKFSQTKFDELALLSEKFSNQDYVNILEILQKALEKMKYALIPQLPLELAVVEICEKKNQKLEIEKEQIVQPTVSTIPQTQLAQLPSQPTGEDIQKLKEKWTYVLETIRPYNFSLEALLRSINIAECTESAVVMEVPYSFHQRILEAPKNRDILESILSEVLNRRIKVSTILGNRPSRVEDINNIEVAQDDEIIKAAAEIFSSDSIN